MDKMDIRIDAGFHHRNPNVYIPPSCVSNPNNKYDPKYMPITMWNLSTVNHLYIVKDTVITFAEQPEINTFNIEIASDEKIKEHLAQPCNWVPQRHETLPEICLILLSFVLQQMYLALARCSCRIRKFPLTSDRDLKNYVKSMVKHSPRTMRTLAEQSLSRWT